VTNMSGEVYAYNKLNPKVLLVGDGAIGKTCFFDRLTGSGQDSIQKNWDNEAEYEPTTFNNTNVPIVGEDGMKHDIEFWDTAGQEAFEQLRKLSYPETSLYLVGFSHISKGSLTNIQHKWLPEVKESEQDPWFVVIGCKKDLYDGKEILQEDVEKQCKAIHACAFVNTSAKERDPNTCGLIRLREIILTLLKMRNEGRPRPDWGELEGYLDQVDPAKQVHSNAADEAKKAEEEAAAKKAEEEAARKKAEETAAKKERLREKCEKDEADKKAIADKKAADEKEKKAAEAAIAAEAAQAPPASTAPVEQVLQEAPKQEEKATSAAGKHSQTPAASTQATTTEGRDVCSQCSQCTVS